MQHIRCSCCCYCSCCLSCPVAGWRLFRGCIAERRRRSKNSSLPSQQPAKEIELDIKQAFFFTQPIHKSSYSHPKSLKSFLLIAAFTCLQFALEFSRFDLDYFHFTFLILLNSGMFLVVKSLFCIAMNSF